MSDQPVVISLDRLTWHAGDEVTGVVWLRNLPIVDEARALKARFELREVGTFLTSRHVLGPRFEAQVTRELRFRLPLPHNGPISWVGRRIQLEWWLVVELDLPSMWALDPRAEAKLQVIPRGAALPVTAQ
ncbi:MAG: hypothetical protein ACOZQL_36780 [Myxococcota bacterium]